MRQIKVLYFALALVASFTEAQIYRCETSQGPVFSDTLCGDQAELITIEDDSSGITPGPPDETREYLAQKREERAEARKEKTQAQVFRAQNPVVHPEQQLVEYPAYWPAGRYWHRPIHRPRPARPSRPIVNPGISDNVLRIPYRRGS